MQLNPVQQTLDCLLFFVLFCFMIYTVVWPADCLQKKMAQHFWKKSLLRGYTCMPWFNVSVNSMDSAIKEVLLVFDSTRTFSSKSPTVTVPFVITNTLVLRVPFLLYFFFTFVTLTAYNKFYHLFSPNQLKWLTGIMICFVYCYFYYFYKFCHIVEILFVESWTLPSLLTSYVVSGKLLNLPKPQFLQFKSEDINSSSHILLYWKWHEIIHLKNFAQCTVPGLIIYI